MKKHITIVALLRVISAILSFIIVTIYLKYYDPKIIGFWASTLGVLAVINSVSILKADFLFPLKNIYGSNVVISNLTAMSYVSICQSISCISFLSLIFAHLGYYYFKPIPIASCLAISILTLVEPLYFLLKSFSQIENKFLEVSLIDLFFTATNLSLIFLLSFTELSYAGLIISYIVSRLTSITLLFLKASYKSKAKFKQVLFRIKNLNFRFLSNPSKFVKRYIDFTSKNTVLVKNSALLAVGQVFSNAWGVGLPLFLTFLYSVEASGYFAILSALMIRPTSILSSSVASVFWQFVGRNLQNNPSIVLQKFIQYTKILILISLCFAILAILFARHLSAFVENSSWNNIEYLFFTMIPWCIGILLSQSLTHLAAHKKQLNKLFLDFMTTINIIFIISISRVLMLGYQYLFLFISLAVGVSYVVLWRINYRELCLASKKLAIAQ